MKPLSLQDVRRAVGGRSTRLLSAEGPMVSAVCTDTREMKPDSLFVALKGDDFDAPPIPRNRRRRRGHRGDRLRNPRPKTSDLRLHRRPRHPHRPGQAGRGTSAKRLRAKVVAVAGSNGKTSTKHLIDAVLRVKLQAAPARPRASTTTSAFP